MARQTKQQKAAELLKKMAAEQGGTLDMSALLALRDNPVVREGATPEVESVLRSLHKPHTFMMRKCKYCGEPFQTNYCYTAYCSDICITEDLRKIGVAYDPFVKKRWEHRMYVTGSVGDEVMQQWWRYEPPEYISSQMLSTLETWAHAFLADLGRLRAEAEAHESRQFEEAMQEFDQSFPAKIAQARTPDPDEEETSLSPEHPPEPQRAFDDEALTSPPSKPQGVSALHALFEDL